MATGQNPTLPVLWAVRKVAMAAGCSFPVYHLLVDESSYKAHVLLGAAAMHDPVCCSATDPNLDVVGFENGPGYML